MAFLKNEFHTFLNEIIKISQFFKDLKKFKTGKEKGQLKIKRNTMFFDDMTPQLCSSAALVLFQNMQGL